MTRSAPTVSQAEIQEHNNNVRAQALNDVLANAGIGAGVGVSLAALGAIYRRFSDYLDEPKEKKRSLGPVIKVKQDSPEATKVAQQTTTQPAPFVPGNPQDRIDDKGDVGYYWPLVIGAPIAAAASSYIGVNALSKWMRKKDMKEKKDKLERQFQDELALTLKDQNIHLTKGASVGSMSDEETGLIFIDMIKDAIDQTQKMKKKAGLDTLVGLLLTVLAGTTIYGGVKGFESTRPNAEQDAIDQIKKRRVITALTTPSAPLVVGSNSHAAAEPADASVETPEDKKKRQAEIAVNSAPSAALPMG